MPSSATITAFYNFSANTKARATQVNANFDVLRGHLIAIDPNTATAATTETYDLGSTEYRWRTGYFRDIDIKANTTTGQALSIIGDTAAGQGAFHFKHGGNIRARIGGGNQYIDLDTTTSQFDFKVAGSSVGSINTTRFILPKRTFYSTGATSPGSAAFTTTAVLVATLSVTSYGGNFLIGLSLRVPNGVNSYCQLVGNTTGAINTMNIKIYRDTTTSEVHWEEWSVTEKSTTSAVSIAFERTSMGPWIDASCSAGAHTYYAYAYSNRATPNTTIAFNNVYFQAIELV